MWKSWGLILLFLFVGVVQVSFAKAPVEDRDSRQDQYNYQTLNSSGAVIWKIESPKKRDINLKPGESFQQLKVQSQQVSIQSLLAKNPNLAKLKVIAIIGDTGCRLKESVAKSSYQDCSDPKKWRYPQVIASIVKEKPDLIIHVGDYHYREQCSAGKACGKMSPEIGYGWGPWKLDFFDPSQSAFAVAPWLIVRGNHEDCHRAYLGYRLLLRNENWSAECEDFETPQVIELGNLAIINLDSSSISDGPEFIGDSQNLWKKRMEVIAEKLKTVKAKHIWMVTHKPVYGLVPLALAYAPVNVNLRKYFENTSWSKRVELILAGHVHNSQVVRAQNEPPQLVIGNGGTALDNSKASISAENISALGYEKAKLVFNDFGYVLIKNPDSDQAQIEFHDSSGAGVFSCHLTGRAQDCF